jgi:hypothetical protein
MKIYEPQITGSLGINGSTIGNFNNLVSTSSFNQYTSSISTGSLATTGSNTFVGNQTISGSVIPAVTNIYDLGDDTHQFRHLYLSSGSLYINGTKVLGATGQELQITTDNGQSLKILEAGSDTITLQSADGNITLATSAGGDVILDPTSGIIALKGTTTLYAGNKLLSSDGNAIQFGNDLGITGSIVTTGNINGINLTTFSSSVATTFNTIQSNTSSLTNRLNNIELTTASIQSQISRIQESTASLNTFSASVDLTIARLRESTASLNLFSSSVESKNVTIASYTASMNEFTASNENTSLNAATSSYAKTNSTNTFSGNQTITGSLYISQDLVIGGSASIQTISSSRLDIGDNIIQLNVNNPSLRFGGIAIFDSGSEGGSGSFLYDSVHDEFVFVHKGNGTNVTSSHFVLGPETYDNLGNETYLTTNILPKGTGKEHLVDSNITDTGTLITLGSNTSVTGMLTANGFTGSIAATNGVVSGSSQTIANLPAGTISGSAQVVSILSSLNTYTGSNDTTNTAQNARLTTIESATGSYETKGRGIVSGSSQITYTGISSIPGGIVSGSSQVTLSSTTGYGSVLNQAVLTTSSPTFAAVTCTGALSVSGNVSFTNYVVSDITFADSYKLMMRNPSMSIDSLKGSYFGYSSGYGVLIVGHTGNNNRSLAFGVDVSANASGAFTGLGNEYIWRGAASFITPNSSNNGYNTLFSWNSSGQMTFNQNATFSGTITENSSLRYKENVETIKYGLDKVLQMRGVTYDKKNTGVKEIGVIAEEIYEVLPEVVLKNEEGEIDSVSYGRITAVLIEAIKDLKKEIEELKANR